MYSLNVPVPAQVGALAGELTAELPDARIRTRGEHTLCVKRLASDRSAPYSRIEARVRELLRGQPPFEVRIDEIALFRDPPIGSAPVVYFAVDAPELVDLHGRLATVYEPVDDGIEGEAYVPHVTIARGGSLELAERVTGEIEPIEWTVSELSFWDAKHNQPISTISLPA